MDALKKTYELYTLQNPDGDFERKVLKRVKINPEKEIIIISDNEGVEEVKIY